MSERPPVVPVGPPPASPPAAPPPPPAQNSGCLTALMVIFGILLLLPGLCFLQFGAGGIGGFLCLAAAFLIIGAIVRATGGRSPT